MSTITEFMGTPVLNAVSEGKPVETQSSKAKAESKDNDDLFTF